MTNQTTLQLTERDAAMLAGDMGPATQMAMRILVTMAGVYGAERLLDSVLACAPPSTVSAPPTTA